MADFVAYRLRVMEGRGEAEHDFLAGHEDLGDLLEPMLAAQDATQLTRATPLTSLEPPQQLGDYRLLKLLGQGGMGVVYLAEHRELGRMVALKLIPAHRLWSEKARVRFRREARAAARLDHPGICRIYEVGEFHGWPFIAMPHMEGETLARKLARSSAPKSRGEMDGIVLLVEKVARALHAAHEGGIVHRDVKPGNILITTDGAPVILDFGLAHDETTADRRLTLTDEHPGTPLYMSPEQIADSGGRVDRRTDVYSLGVTLYECLTLQNPFSGKSSHELSQRILESDPLPVDRANSRVPRDLRIVVETAMQRDPSRRYSTALAFAEDLCRIRNCEPIQARPSAPLTRAKRWLKRHPVAASVVLILGLALVGSVALYLRAEGALARFDLLSTAVRMRKAKELEPKLWPPWPEMAPELRRWVEDLGEPLVAALPAIEATLRHLRHGAAPTGPGNELHFESAADQLLYDTLAATVPELRAWAMPEGLLAQMRQRLAWAESLHHRSIAQHRAEWDEAIAAIRASDGVTASELYEHLELSPQIGLVPLGMDPRSALWEFVHLRSGVPDREFPARAPETGDLVITGETGIVFTLIPGGSFVIGAQNRDPRGPNYDRDLLGTELPTRLVELEPFFLSKYEMTQGQWRRLSNGENPSLFKAGMDLPEGGTIGYANPVEYVSWHECDELMRRYGIVLPTEAQWEYACRAGTSTPWSCGVEEGSLRGHANLADRSFNEFIPWAHVDWDDGHSRHAPVGIFAPNAFGMHDMHGNVSEWCRDWKGNPDDPLDEGNGLRVTDTRIERVHRSAAFNGQPRDLKSAARMARPPDHRYDSLGLRPARRILR